MPAHRNLHTVFWRAVLAALMLAMVACAARAAPPATVRQMAMGRAHACALTQAGALLCWGANDQGQVGNGEIGKDVSAPYEVFGDGVAQVSAGFDFTCAIVRAALYCWGANKNGQIGVSGAPEAVGKPQRVLDGGVSFVVASRNEIPRTCAVVAGALRCWGANVSGELGATNVQGHLSEPVTLIEAGVDAADIGISQLCAIVRGALHCWGDTLDGRHTPAQPRELLHDGVTQLAVGTNHACAIAHDALYCWGEDRQGGIGIQTHDRFVVQPVRVFAGGVSAVAVDNAVGAANQHTCAIVAGVLWCLGNNYAGEIAPASREPRLYTPQRVLAGVDAIWESAFGSRCLRVGGKLRCRMRGGGAADGQLLVGHDVRTDLLPWTSTLGDIDAIDPGTPARLDAAGDAELRRSAAAAQELLRGKLVADADSVFRVRQAHVGLADGRFTFDFDAVPLLRIDRRDVERAANDNVLGFAAAVVPGAACGDTTHEIGDPGADAPEQLFVQEGDRFVSLGAALRDVSALIPTMLGPWSPPAATPATTVDAAREFARINACAAGIAQQWDAAPFAAIRLEDADGTAQNVAPRPGGVWHSTRLHDVVRVDVQPKAHTSEVDTSEADFAVEAQTVGAVQCGDIDFVATRHAQSPAWQLHREGSQYLLVDSVREQMALERPALSRPTRTDVRGALERAHASLDVDSVVAGCQALLWGRKFTVRYRGAAVAQLYIKSAEPESYAFDSGTESDPALHWVNRLGIEPSPQFAVAKAWPGDASRTLLAYATSSDAPDADIAQFDLSVVLVDTASGKILQRYDEPGAITSDALRFQGLSLDTANYAVQPGARAIGVRISHEHIGGTSADLGTLMLLMSRGGELVPIVRNLLVDQAVSDRGPCEESRTMKRTIEIAPTVTLGYADLIVRERSEEQHQVQQGEQCVGNPSKSTATYLLHFDGDKYVVPPELAD